MPGGRVHATGGIGNQRRDPVPAPERAGPGAGPDVDVLVVGAGPTGLTAAAEALRQGLSVRIIERKAGRSAFSKALVVHARTMEVFDTMGIAEAIRSVGAPFAALNVGPRSGRRRLRIDLLGLPWGDTAYPYWLSVPQFETERVLEAHLVRLGGKVEWSCALRELADRGNVAEAVLQQGDGTETVRARWVIGCDGGRSTVRDQAGIRLTRTGAGAAFLLADTKSTCDLVEDEGYVYLAREGVLIIVPMPEPGRWRLIAHVPTSAVGPDGAVAEVAGIDAGDLDRLIRQRAGIQFGSHDVSWTSRFNLSHGVADRFRNGRVFIAGDAAHVHSPVGGQGLNTGVQDAHNLLWKLAAARQLPLERAEALLDSYESERHGTAESMVRGVARMTAILTSNRRVLRGTLGRVAPRILARPSVQARLGRGVGMLNLSYPGTVGEPGKSADGLEVGRRLPNPELRSGGRLFDRLSGTGYCWAVYEAGDGVRCDPGAARWGGLPVVFVSREELRDPVPGPRRTRAVLVRPDRHIAAVGPDPQSLRDAPRSTPRTRNDANRC